MHDLRWFLLAWGVFALAAAVKFARLARQMRGSLGVSATLQQQAQEPEALQTEDSQKAREQLERIWLKR